MSTSIDAWVGVELAGYRIDSLVGRGGMGVVYRAWDARLKRHVAVKLISPALSENGTFRERFLTESELAASLEHPNVIPVHGAGEVDVRAAAGTSAEITAQYEFHGGYRPSLRLYLVMRFVEGLDLKTLLARDGPLEPARAVAVCAQLASALDAAHSRGLVHRDVKPSNVLLDESEHVYLADFGLTRELAEQGPGAGDGHSVGTPAYVAPEQIRGDAAGGAADQYALGCVLYECLTGEPPFPRERELAVLFAHLEEEPPPASERNGALPPALDAVLARALAKDPAARFGSCAELVAATREALALRDVVVVRDRGPLLLVLAGVLVVIAASIAAILLARDGGGNPELADATDSLVRIDPSEGEVTGRFKVGPGANAVAVGAGYAWVTSVSDSLVWRIDPASGETKRIQEFLEPQGVVVASLQDSAQDPSRTVVVSNMRGIGTIDPGPGVASGPQEGPIGYAPLLAAGELGVWAAGSGVVGKVAGAGYAWAQIAGRIHVQPPPRGDRQLSSYGGLAVGSDAIWLSGGLLEHALFRVDPRTRSVRRIPLGAAAGALALGSDAVWVASPTADVVWRIDPASGRVTDAIEVGRAPVALAFGDRALWVALSVDGTAQRIDPSRREVVDTVEVGGVPSAIAVADDSVWVASRAP